MDLVPDVDPVTPRRGHDCYKLHRSRITLVSGRESDNVSASAILYLLYLALPLIVHTLPSCLVCLSVCLSVCECVDRWSLKTSSQCSPSPASPPTFAVPLSVCTPACCLHVYLWLPVRSTCQRPRRLPFVTSPDQSFHRSKRHDTDVTKASRQPPLLAAPR